MRRTQASFLVVGDANFSINAQDDRRGSPLWLKVFRTPAGSRGQQGIQSNGISQLLSQCSVLDLTEAGRVKSSEQSPPRFRYAFPSSLFVFWCFFFLKRVWSLKNGHSEGSRGTEAPHPATSLH
ncbi:UNVERIFIED_CONTAM: hypothetical protein K2H54_052611 [Gekko kuhli]